MEMDPLMMSNTEAPPRSPAVISATSNSSQAQELQQQPQHPLPRRSAQNSLTVPVTEEPGQGPIPHRQRRCSARLLSVNVREALKNLRQREHKARVTALVQRNANFYRRQKLCECVVLLGGLTIFSAFSLYVVFAYGFHFGQREPFSLVQDDFPSKVTRNEGESTELWCQVDAPWEWCRWIHYDRYCEYEWLTSSGGVDEIGCDFEPGKVERIGDYDKHQCGVRIHDLERSDRGIWMCEVEKYYAGFSRRYGEMQTSLFTVVVIEHPPPGNGSRTTTTASTTSTSSTTEASRSDSPASTEETTSEAENATATEAPWKLQYYVPGGKFNTKEELEDYQRRFFMLKVFVLGGIGIVLGILAVIFWIYFFILYQTWDANKRDMSGNDSRRNGMTQIEAAAEALYEGMSRPNSRRKSVAFAVVKPVQDGDNISFDITTRSVALEGGGNSAGGSGSIGGSGSDCIGKNASTSPTPSAPVMNVGGGSMERLERPYRRLSLAPEDALFPASQRAFLLSTFERRRSSAKEQTAFPFPPPTERSEDEEEDERQ